MTTKRIIRKRRLTSEEAEKYQLIRDQVSEELPDLIARHQDRCPECGGKMGDGIALVGIVSRGVADYYDDNPPGERAPGRTMGYGPEVELADVKKCGSCGHSEELACCSDCDSTVNVESTYCGSLCHKCLREHIKECEICRADSGIQVMIKK